MKLLTQRKIKIPPNSHSYICSTRLMVLFTFSSPYGKRQQWCENSRRGDNAREFTRLLIFTRCATNVQPSPYINLPCSCRSTWLPKFRSLFTVETFKCKYVFSLKLLMPSISFHCNVQRDTSAKRNHFSFCAMNSSILNYFLVLITEAEEWWILRFECCKHNSKEHVERKKNFDFDIKEKVRLR